MPGNQEPIEKKEGPGMNISDSRGLWLPFCLFLLTGGLNNTVSFSLGGRDTAWGVFLGSSLFGGKPRGLRIRDSWRKTYSPEAYEF